MYMSDNDSHVNMNKIIGLIAALVACSDHQEVQTDARIHDASVTIDSRAPDAATTPDAAPPQNHGCDMGNLPESRTITLGPDDPVPSALLDELQDMHTGDRRKTFVRQFFPSFLVQTGWGAIANVTAGGVTRPAITSTGASTTGLLSVPIEVGDRMKSIRMFVCGNGVAVLNADVVHNTDFLVVAGTTNFHLGPSTPSAAWQVANFSNIAGPYVQVVGGFTELRLNVSLAGYSIGLIEATFDRP